jgi:hypothetical protein
MINKMVRYFDLQSQRRSTIPRGLASAPPAPVLPQYLAVCAGIIAEPFLRIYIETGEWNFVLGAFFGRVVFGLLIGIILLPAVYKSSFDPSKPVTVQLAALFPMGIGWQAIVSSATKGVIG